MLLLKQSMYVRHLSDMDFEEKGNDIILLLLVAHLILYPVII